MAENIDYEDLKKRGFLKQKQKGFFILRTRMSSGVYNDTALEKIAGIARKYAKGLVHASTRQGIEIPFIKFEDIGKVEGELKGANIKIGTSGARLRTITTCPGNNWCKAGLVNTFKLGDRIENELGLKCGLDLPHKFKIAISGCPNTCTRPQASEIGIHGRIDTASADKRIGYAIYIGGCGGRNPHEGTKVEGVFTEDAVLAVVGYVVKFFKENAKPRQRLWQTIDEKGREDFYCHLKSFRG